MWPFKKKVEHIKTETIEPARERVKSAGNLQYLDSPIQHNFLTALTASKKKQKFNNDALLLMYETVSQVNSVINYIAITGSNIPVKHVKYLGNGKTKDLGETELLKSINSPNKGVSLNSLLEDILIQYLIQGNCPLFKDVTPGFKYPTKYDVLSAKNVYKIPQYSIDQYGTPSMSVDVRNNPIVAYKSELENGTLQRLELEQICYISDKNPRKIGIDYYYGASRLYAATRTISVLSNLYDTINTILAAKGALGFISRQTVQGEVDPAQWNEIVEEVERKLNEDYGTTGNRKAIMATVANLRWNRMDAPINDYIPIELTQQEFAQLCNQFGMPDVLMNSKGTSTYNNVTELKRAFYQNSIMPLLNNVWNSISLDLGITKQNEWLVADYSIIPEMNEVSIDKVKYSFDNKMLTKNQVLNMFGFPENSDQSFNEIETPKEDGTEGIQDKGVTG